MPKKKVLIEIDGAVWHDFKILAMEKEYPSVSNAVEKVLIGELHAHFKR